MSLFVQKNLGDLIRAASENFPEDGYDFVTSGITVSVFNDQINISAIKDAARASSNSGSATWEGDYAAPTSFTGTHVLIFNGCEREYLDTLTDGDFKRTERYNNMILWMDRNPNFHGRGDGFNTFIYQYQFALRQHFAAIPITAMPIMVTPITDMHMPLDIINITPEPTPEPVVEPPQPVQEPENPDPVIAGRIRNIKD